jgi:hypothetical protein
VEGRLKMPSQQVSHDLAQTCRRDVNAYNYDVLYTNEWRHYSTLFSTSPRSTQRSLIIFKCGGILINKWGGGHPPPHTPPHSTTLHHTPPHSTTLHHTPPHSTTKKGVERPLFYYWRNINDALKFIDVFVDTLSVRRYVIIKECTKFFL